MEMICPSLPSVRPLWATLDLCYEPACERSIEPPQLMDDHVSPPRIHPLLAPNPYACFWSHMPSYASYLLESWDSNFFAVSCNLFILRPGWTLCKAETNPDQTWQRECTNENTWTTRIGRHVNAPDMQCVRLPAPHACLTQHVKSEVQK